MTAAHRRRALLLLAGAALVAPGARAQASSSYAVVSLCADSITFTVAQMTTGSHLDRNKHQTIPMPDDSLEIAALQTAEAEIRRLEPAAAVELYTTRNAKAYEAQKQAAADGAMSPLLEALQPALRDSKATHLLLVGRYRQDPRFKLIDGTTGIGQISGLGFYVDETMNLIDTETGNQMLGFVAPYAVLKVQLVDLATRRVVREAVSQASEIIGRKQQADSAWTSMSSQEKMQKLREMLHEAAVDGIGRALATP